MNYRVIIRPKWTMVNASSSNKWRVEYLFLGIIWIKTSDVWHTKEEAEQYIKDLKKEY